MARIDRTKEFGFDKFLEAVGLGIIPTEQYSGLSEARETMYLKHLLQAYQHMRSDDSILLSKDRVETRMAVFLKVRSSLTLWYSTDGYSSSLRRATRSPGQLAWKKANCHSHQQLGLMQLPMRFPFCQPRLLSLRPPN